MLLPTKPMDRSYCFIFYRTYYEQVKLIEKYYGMKTAYEALSALIDYALYEKEIEDPMIKFLIGDVTIDFIDARQYLREIMAKTRNTEGYYG